MEHIISKDVTVNMPFFLYREWLVKYHTGIDATAHSSQINILLKILMRTRERRYNIACNNILLTKELTSLFKRIEEQDYQINSHSKIEGERRPGGSVVADIVQPGMG